MKNGFINLIYAFLLDAVILFASIKSIQPDPKGIALFLIITITGFVASFAGAFALYFEYRKESFLYSWASVTGLVNFYFLFQFQRSAACCGLNSILSFDSIFLLEASLSVYMLSKFLRRKE